MGEAPTVIIVIFGVAGAAFKQYRRLFFAIAAVTGVGSTA